ncbi:hypothetical protein R1flu_017735 [Riccia fluitans]|uniref:Uncharacterized protein n=1 Tax=Riccia fluitans TaxID=41844 RepID=A0ABD1ZDT4_9MARC
MKLDPARLHQWTGTKGRIDDLGITEPWMADVPVLRGHPGAYHVSKADQTGVRSWKSSLAPGRGNEPSRMALMTRRPNVRGRTRKVWTMASHEQGGTRSAHTRTKDVDWLTWASSGDMLVNTTQAKQTTKLLRKPFDELNLQTDKLLDVCRISPGRKRPADHDEVKLIGATTHKQQNQQSDASRCRQCEPTGLALAFDSASSPHSETNHE